MSLLDQLPHNSPDLFTNNIFGQRRYKTQTSIVANDGHEVSVQNPLPTDGDSIYVKDVWLEQSNIGDFSGSITDLFDNLHTVITNSSSTNPKVILVHFNRTIISNTLGIGAFSGNFSNIKIGIINSGGVETIVFDNSSSNTKYTNRTIQLPVTAGFNAIKIYFHTVDTVSLSNLVILKTVNTISRLQAKKPDNMVTDINATAGGNLKISLEEYENTFLTSPLPVRIIDSRTGRESEIDVITFGLVTIDNAHHEIHEGNHYFVKDWVDIPSAGTVDFLFVAGIIEPHMRTVFEGTSAFQVDIYENTVTSNNGTSITIQNRRRNSLNTCGCSLYSSPTITSTGNVIVRYKLGAGRSAGGAASAENEVVLKPSTKYLIRITNNVTGATNTIDFLADWYEHTE